jgi:hypothetical protein
MAETRDQGAIPQGLIEQARARPVDPGKLQLLGKQAAALYSDAGTPLTQAVLSVIGSEDVGPEHARRVCEFANQEAFQREWEKGGSVRNVEFSGGPADPAVVLRELNDGARPEAIRVSDYDEPPSKLARADRRVEEEIFGKYAHPIIHHSEVPSGVPDLHRLRQTITGAQDHFHSKLSAAEVTKEALARELGDEVCKAVMSGDSLFKIANAWSHFSTDRVTFQEALDVSIDRMRERRVPGWDTEVEKLAGQQESIGRIPNPEHPVISRFIEFRKVATQLRILKGASEVLEEQLQPVDRALRGGIQ